MSVKEPDRLPVELIGSPSFFPALLTYIRASSGPPNLPLDEVIIKSILLCIVAGNKHLILRTPEEDIGLVVKATAWTLSYLFNYTTQRLKLRSYSSNISRSAFLGSLFLPSQHANGSQEDVHRRHSRAGGRGPNRMLGNDYPRSGSSPNDTFQGPSHSRQTSSGPQRNPSDLEVQLDIPWSSKTPAPQLFHSFTDPTTPHRPPHISHDSQDWHQSVEFPQALVLSGLEKSSQLVQRALMQMLAKRGLSLADVRDDFSEPTPSEETLAWPLPTGFIMIYVCSIDTRERPTIHQSLLDRFAMSHNVLLSQAVRYALRSTTPYSAQSGHGHGPSSSYSNSNSPSMPFQSPLPQQSQSYTPPYFNKSMPSPLHRQQSSASSIFPPPLLFQSSSDRPAIIPKWFIDTLQQSCKQAHFPPHLDLYLSDLFSAVRHHPKLDGLLLSATARRDAEDLSRAARVIGSDLTGMELLRPPGSLSEPKDKSDENEGVVADDLSEYYSIQEQMINDPSHIHVLDHSPSVSRKLHLDETETTHLLRTDSSVFGSPTRKRTEPRTATTTLSGGGVYRGTHEQEREDDISPNDVEVLDVTEADVARMVPRVVTHRLRLRDGPEEEVLASAVFGATFNNVPPKIPSNFEQGGKEGNEEDIEEKNDRDGFGFEHDEGVGKGYGELGIKDILVDILNKV